MDAVQMRAGEDLGLSSPDEVQIGKNRGALGPPGPILRALGLGFTLGLAVMTVLTLLSQ